jgi:hypothetical protein
VVPKANCRTCNWARAHYWTSWGGKLSGNTTLLYVPISNIGLGRRFGTFLSPNSNYRVFVERRNAWLSLPSTLHSERSRQLPRKAVLRLGYYDENYKHSYCFCRDRLRQQQIQAIRRTGKKRQSSPATRHGSAWGERRYSSYSFFTSALDWGEWSVSRPRERTPGTHCTGGWVGLRAGLDTEVTRNILCSCRVSNPDCPVVQSVVKTLYWLSYPGSRSGKTEEYRNITFPRPIPGYPLHDTAVLLFNMDPVSCGSSMKSTTDIPCTVTYLTKLFMCLVYLVSDCRKIEEKLV